MFILLWFQSVLPIRGPGTPAGSESCGVSPPFSLRINKLRQCPCHLVPATEFYHRLAQIEQAPAPCSLPASRRKTSAPGMQIEYLLLAKWVKSRRWRRALCSSLDIFPVNPPAPVRQGLAAAPAGSVSSRVNFCAVDRALLSRDRHPCAPAERDLTGCARRSPAPRCKPNMIACATIKRFSPRHCPSGCSGSLSASR